jgi:hypothetical protein
MVREGDINVDEERLLTGDWLTAASFSRPRLHAQVTACRMCPSATGDQPFVCALDRSRVQTKGLRRHETGLKHSLGVEKVGGG